MNKPQSLILKFEPRTIEHLGVKMYSTIPPALAELVANSYDACAKNVKIELFNQPEKRIVVIDDGTGMNFDEINNHFLRIGRDRRKENQPVLCDRFPTGKKGLGKLALFGLGSSIEIKTVKDNQRTKFTLNYNEIKDSDSTEYNPKYSTSHTDDSNGTEISLTELTHKSPFSAEVYANSLGRLFNFSDQEFKLSISVDGQDPILIDNLRKYEQLLPEFEWDETKLKDLVDIEYEFKDHIRGKILTTEKPIKPHLTGITLFANGRLINAPEFFGKSESSHFFSYATGYLDVNFVDKWEEDVISTNRQSIDWELEKPQELRNYLGNVVAQVEKDWRDKRTAKRKLSITKITGINVEKWRETLSPKVVLSVDKILNQVEVSELVGEDQSKLVQSLHDLVPEYPNLHWRELHPQIQDAAGVDYQNKDYYRAFIEAVKRYVTKVKEKSKSKAQSDSAVMSSEFGFDKVLQVAKKYNKPDGNPFHADTYKCIEEGQKFLSMGIVSGARNPVSHEEIADLRVSGLFTEMDCLDMLSILSHLFKRLEDATQP